MSLLSKRVYKTLTSFSSIKCYILEERFIKIHISLEANAICSIIWIMFFSKTSSIPIILFMFFVTQIYSSELAKRLSLRHKYAYGAAFHGSADISLTPRTHEVQRSLSSIDPQMREEMNSRKRAKKIQMGWQDFSIFVDWVCSNILSDLFDDRVD